MNRRYRKKNHVQEFQQFVISWDSPKEAYANWRKRFVNDADPREKQDEDECNEFEVFLCYLDTLDMGLGGWVGKAGIQKNDPRSGRLGSCTQEDIRKIQEWMKARPGWEELWQDLRLENAWWDKYNADRIKPDGRICRKGWYNIWTWKRERRQWLKECREREVKKQG